MKDYYKYWKKRIAESEESYYEWFCRDEEPEEDSIYVFCIETNNNGPCFLSAGEWYWSKEICELASWIIEFQLRNIFSCCYEGKDMKETLDYRGVEYLRKIAVTQGGAPLAKVLALAEELQGKIDDGMLTFDVFANWIRRYEKISEDLPVSVEFELFNGLDEAISLLREHEYDQDEDREALDLAERFQIDCIC